jgi:hypothetical protein
MLTSVRTRVTARAATLTPSKVIREFHWTSDKITSTNTERALGATFAVTVFGFGTWLYDMERRSAALAKHLDAIRRIGASLDDGAQHLHKIARNTSETPEEEK